MFCKQCGLQIDDDSKFCRKCGCSLDSTDNNTVSEVKSDDKLLFSVDMFKVARDNKTLDFYSGHLIYNGKRINYSDIDGVSHLLKRTEYSIYFIPTNTTSTLKLELSVNGKVVVIDSSAPSFMQFETKTQKEQENIYSKIAYVVNMVIVPIVIEKLFNKYIEGQELNVSDKIRITPSGIYKKSEGFWGEKFLAWEQCKGATIEDGDLFIYSDKDIFFSGSGSRMNRIALPGLIKKIKDEREAKKN